MEGGTKALFSMTNDTGLAMSSLATETSILESTSKEKPMERASIPGPHSTTSMKGSGTKASSTATGSGKPKMSTSVNGKKTSLTASESTLGRMVTITKVSGSIAWGMAMARMYLSSVISTLASISLGKQRDMGSTDGATAIFTQGSSSVASNRAEVTGLKVGKRTTIAILVST